LTGVPDVEARITDAERSTPEVRRRRVIPLLTACLALFVLPALFLGGTLPQPRTPVGLYRITAIAAFALIAFYWNLVFWFDGVYARISRLGSKVQQETRARVVVTPRGVEWDRPVGIGKHLVLQGQLLLLVVLSFCVWAPALFGAVMVMILMTSGIDGLRAFLVIP
jgi:hypothetical protein